MLGVKEQEIKISEDLLLKLYMSLFLCLFGFF